MTQAVRCLCSFLFVISGRPLSRGGTPTTFLHQAKTVSCRSGPVPVPVAAAVAVAATEIAEEGRIPAEEGCIPAEGGRVPAEGGRIPAAVAVEAIESAEGGRIPAEAHPAEAAR